MGEQEWKMVRGLSSWNAKSGSSPGAREIRAEVIEWLVVSS
jgi:hypothetical protein